MHTDHTHTLSTDLPLSLSLSLSTLRRLRSPRTSSKTLNPRHLIPAEGENLPHHLHDSTIFSVPDFPRTVGARMVVCHWFLGHTPLATTDVCLVF